MAYSAALCSCACVTTLAMAGSAVSPPGGASVAALAAAFQLYCARSSAMGSRSFGGGAFCASSTTCTVG